MKSRMVSSKSIKRLASIGEAVPDASGYEYAGGNTKGSFTPRFFRITGVRDPCGEDAAADDDSLAIPRLGSFPPPTAPARTPPIGVFFARLIPTRTVSRPSIIVVPFVVVVVVARKAAIIIIVILWSFVSYFVSLRFRRPTPSVCASQSKAQS